VYVELKKDYENIQLLDLSATGAMPELDFGKDFFDGGHMNHYGAVKVSRALAEHLAATYDLPDRRGDEAYERWDRELAEHDAFVGRSLAKAERTAREAKAKAKAKADAEAQKE
jgi:hypothetical protein